MDFDNAADWCSDDDWQGPGTDIFDGKIEDDEFKIDDGKTFAHYMKKFQDRKFEKIKVIVSIDDPEESEVWLKIKTSNDPEFDDIKSEESFELENGIFEEKLDLEWEKYTFFKILPERTDSDIESPVIEKIELETELDQEDVEPESDVVEEDVEDVEDIEEEEMPAFEDVEYKELDCPECGEEFKTDIGLKVHRKVNHPESYQEEED